MATNTRESPLLRIFAANVRRLRLERNLSQEGLAELAGIHRTYVGMIERSEKNATIYNIERLARALGVEPHTLLKRSEVF